VDGAVEVGFVLTQHGSGVVFVVDQDPVGALGSDAADEAFRERVRPRRPGRSRDDIDALGSEDGSVALSVRQDRRPQVFRPRSTSSSDADFANRDKGELLVRREAG
jgi:hypothetical protein